MGQVTTNGGSLTSGPAQIDLSSVLNVCKRLKKEGKKRGSSVKKSSDDEEDESSRSNASQPAVSKNLSGKLGPPGGSKLNKHVVVGKSESGSGKAKISSSMKTTTTTTSTVQTEGTAKSNN